MDGDADAERDDRRLGPDGGAVTLRILRAGGADFGSEPRGSEENGLWLAGDEACLDDPPEASSASPAKTPLEYNAESHWSERPSVRELIFTFGLFA